MEVGPIQEIKNKAVNELSGNVEVKAREAVFGNKKNNNHAERLWRLDQFKKLKTRL